MRDLCLTIRTGASFRLGIGDAEAAIAIPGLRLLLRLAAASHGA